MVHHTRHGSDHQQWHMGWTCKWNNTFFILSEEHTGWCGPLLCMADLSSEVFWYHTPVYSKTIYAPRKMKNTIPEKLNGCWQICCPPKNKLLSTLAYNLLHLFALGNDEKNPSYSKPDDSGFWPVFCLTSLSWNCETDDSYHTHYIQKSWYTTILSNKVACLTNSIDSNEKVLYAEVSCCIRCRLVGNRQGSVSHMVLPLSLVYILVSISFVYIFMLTTYVFASISMHVFLLSLHSETNLQLYCLYFSCTFATNYFQLCTDSVTYKWIHSVIFLSHLTSCQSTNTEVRSIILIHKGHLLTEYLGLLSR